MGKGNLFKKTLNTRYFGRKPNFYNEERGSKMGVDNQEVLLKVLFKDENKVERPTLIKCKDKSELDNAIEHCALVMNDLALFNMEFDTLHDGKINSKNITNVIGVML